jgi:hypothetical protein
MVSQKFQINASFNLRSFYAFIVFLLSTFTNLRFVFVMPKHLLQLKNVAIISRMTVHDGCHISNNKF